jgi:putative flippase GtrA
MPTERLSLLDRVRGAIDVLYREMLKFGVVGAVAFVIDLGGYNLPSDHT